MELYVLVRDVQIGDIIGQVGFVTHYLFTIGQVGFVTHYLFTIGQVGFVTHYLFTIGQVGFALTTYSLLDRWNL